MARGTQVTEMKVGKFSSCLFFKRELRMVLKTQSSVRRLDLAGGSGSYYLPSGIRALNFGYMAEK